MAACCLLLFFVFLSLISLSQEGCYDCFSRDKWSGTNVTDLIPLINATSPEEILKCTMWKNKEQKLFSDIISCCFKNEDLGEKCKQTTEGNHKMYIFHFRCLYARLRNVSYNNDSIKNIFGDCQYFSSGIKTMEWLWNSSAIRSNVDWRKGSSTDTSALAGHSTSILVLLILSIIGNLMQGLNSFLQKRRLKKKQKEMSDECISLNTDATAAEKSLTYSNETVN